MFFRCNSSKECSKSKSIWYGTVLYNAKIPYQKIMLRFYCIYSVVYIIDFPNINSLLRNFSMNSSNIHLRKLHYIFIYSKV